MMIARRACHIPFGQSAILCGLVLALVSGAALAGPKGGRTVSGSATITQNGAQTTIRAGNNAIIDYQSFSIGSGELVHFIQPGANSRVLNRVVGGDASVISGLLQSNGRVYIVNPAGIYFGNTAVLNVGALYAAAGHMSNPDFLGNVNHFTELSGSVVNRGAINGSAAYLMGRQVFNYGSIVCPQGMVALAAGDDVYVSEQIGSVLVKVAGGPADAAAASPDGAASPNAAATPAGTAGATPPPSGRGVFSAGDMYSLAVRNTGTIQAKDIHIEAAAGKVAVSGKLDASDKTPGATGGKIVVTGPSVELAGATIDASGQSGGGTVLIGGGFQGKNPDVRNATITSVSADSAIRADAIRIGDGGRIVVWSDQATAVLGAVSARGGPAAGNGGFVELSSHDFLTVAGARVDTTAPKGLGGTLLLDPRNIIINDVGGDGPVSGNQLYTDGVGATVTFTPADLRAWLTANATLTLQANTDVLVESAVVDLATGVPGGRTLTLDAGRHIIFAQVPDTATPANSTGAVALTMNNGALVMKYNDNASVAADRAAGTGELFMAAGSSVVTTGPGSGAFAIDISQGTLAPTTGGITLGDLDTTGGAGLAGGNIRIITAGAIAAQSITASGGSDSAAGSVTLTAGAAQALTVSGAITSLGGTDLALAGGHAGGLVSVSGNPMSVGSVDASGSDAGVGSGLAGGNAAPILMVSTTAVVLNGDLTARGGLGDGAGIQGAGGVIGLAGPVTLGNDIAIDDSGSSTVGITFTNTITSAQSLSLTSVGAGGAVTFLGAVGSPTPLANLTITAPTVNLNAPVNTVAGPTGIGIDTVRVHSGGRINDGIALAPSGATVSLDGDVTYPEDVLVNNNTPITLSVTTGTATAFSWASIGVVTTQLNGSFATTAGGATQDFNFAGPVVLSGNTALDSAGGDIQFQQTLDGTTARGQTLTLTSGAGNMTFAGDVGGATPLGAVTINAANTISAAGDFAAASINQTAFSTGDVTFNTITTSLAGTNGGNVALRAGTGFTLALNGAVNAAGGSAPALGAGLAGGSITLTGDTVNMAAIDASGSAAAVGSGLAGGNAGLILVVGAVSTVLNGNLTATGGQGDGAGAQGAGNSVVLGNVVTLANDIAIDASGASAGGITFTGAITGAQSLSLTSVGAGGAVTFQGAVGSPTPLANLTITAPTVNLNAPINTVAGPTGIGVATVNVHSGGRINDGIALAPAGATVTIDSGTYSEDVLVNNNTPITLSVTTGTATAFSWASIAGVTTLLNGSFATTAGGATQDFNFAGPVALAGNTTLNSAGGDIQFQQTLDGTTTRGQTLALTSGAGNLTFAGDVGATTILGAVTINAANTVSAAGAFVAASLAQTVSSTGDTTFNTITTSGAANSNAGNVTLSATTGQHLTVTGAITAVGGPDVTLAGGHNGGTVVFLGFLASAASVDASGSPAGAGSGANGGAGGFIGIAGGTSITLNGNLTNRGGAGDGAGQQGAGGAIDVVGPTTLANDVAMDASGSPAGTIDFSTTITGAHSLALTAVGAGGAVTLGGNVGSPTPLTDLTITAPTVSLAGALNTVAEPTGVGVTTVDVHAGARISDGITLAAAGATISIDGGVTYPEDVLVNGNTPITLTVTSGVATAFSWTSIAGVTTRLSGVFATTAGGATQNFDFAGPVLLAGNTTLNSVGGDIILRAAVNDTARGAHGLALITATGNVRADGDIGGLTLPASLTVAAGNNIVLHDVATTGDQFYFASGKIALNSSYRSVNGAIEFDTDRSAPPTTATIYKASGNVIIAAGTNFTMHRNDKLTVLGNLTITAGGTAQLGDVTASGDLAVSADRIEIITRPAGEFLTPSGGLRPDQGVQLFAGGTMALNGATTAIGGFNAPVLATPSGSAGNSGALIVRQVSFTAADLVGPGGVILAAPDQALGNVNTTLATAFPGALLPPLEPTEYLPDWSIAWMNELELYGIALRKPSGAETVAALTGYALYDDLPGSRSGLAAGQPAASGVYVPDPAKVVTVRLSGANAARLVKLYRDVLWDREDIEYISKAPAIKLALKQALAAYIADAKPAQVKGLAFREYLERTPALAATLTTLNKLGALFAALDETGLNALEIAHAKGVILTGITPAGIEPAELQAAIQASTNHSGR